MTRHPGHQPLSVEPDLPERLSRDELSDEEGDTLLLNCLFEWGKSSSCSHVVVSDKGMPPQADDSSLTSHVECL